MTRVAVLRTARDVVGVIVVAWRSTSGRIVSSAQGLLWRLGGLRRRAALLLLVR